MKNLIVLIATVLITINLQAQEIAGQWQGLLDVQGMQLTVVFNVEADGDNYISTMDSPDQGATGIPTTATKFEENKLTVTIDEMQLKYEGALSEDGTIVKGTFNQGPMSLPLELSRKKVEKKVVPRKQDPTDIKYGQEEVKFKNENGGHRLAGTLTIPENGEFEKVVVLISGSGPQNRNEELLNHRPFLVLSDYLTRNGIAVLRYDDRGVADSEGDHSIATTADFATDANAAVEYLKTREDMVGKKIGLAGHSEGGMIAPITATQNNDVDFIALLAGPGMEITDLLLDQSEKIGAAEGTPKEILDVNTQIMSKVYDFMKSNSKLEKAEMEKGLMNIYEKNYKLFPEEVIAQIEADKDAFFKSQIDAVSGEWFLYFMNYSPADYLTKVTCPVLAINGGLDLQVTPENLIAVETALAKGGNKNVTTKLFENQNHLFQIAKTGAPSEYSEIEETFNEETMEFIANWIHNYSK